MTGTTRATDAVRRALRRLDAWTLTTFNPRYPPRATDHAADRR